jgi:hypothetical protein
MGGREGGREREMEGGWEGGREEGTMNKMRERIENQRDQYRNVTNWPW